MKKRVCFTLFMVPIMAMASVLFAGCLSKGISYKIKFDQIKGLKEGDRVVFNDAPIGSVTHITYTKDGDFMVDIEIKDSSAPYVTNKSRFYIVEDKDNRGHKCIEMVHVSETGTPLEHGTVIVGSSKFSALSEKALEQLNLGIKGLRRKLDEFYRNLKNLPKDEKIKELKKELDMLSKELAEKGKEGVEKFNKEILPYLKKQIKELEKRLDELKKSDKTNNRGVEV